MKTEPFLVNCGSQIPASYSYLPFRLTATKKSLGTINAKTMSENSPSKKNQQLNNPKSIYHIRHMLQPCNVIQPLKFVLLGLSVHFENLGIHMSSDIWGILSLKVG